MLQKRSTGLRYKIVELSILQINFQVDCNSNPTGEIGFVCQPRRDFDECEGAENGGGGAAFSTLSTILFFLTFSVFE